MAMPKNALSKIKGNLHKPYFKTAEAKKAGISPSLLAYYAQKGTLKRLHYGVYQFAGEDSMSNILDFRWEDLVEAIRRVPAGIVCLISALALYELTDEIPRVHWIAIPNSTSAKIFPGVKFVRMRNTELGKTTYVLDGEKFPIFDRERTLVDAFRLLSKETAIKALQRALAKKKEQKIDLEKLRKYAKLLRMDIDSYILALTT